MTNQFVPWTAGYAHEMSPSLSPQELLNVKKTLLQHCSFMTDKTLLNDLLCSIDLKLQAQHVTGSYPLASTGFDASSKLSPHVLGGHGTLSAPCQNELLTSKPSDPPRSVPSHELNKNVWTPSKVDGVQASSSQMIQKRLSSTPMSKVLPRSGSKPPVVRSLNDSLSFSEISGPQSCFASPLRVFSGNGNSFPKVTESEETFPKVGSAPDVKKIEHYDKWNGKSLEVSKAVLTDDAQPTLSERVLESNSVQHNNRLVPYSNGRLEVDYMCEKPAPVSRDESEVPNRQNGKVAGALHHNFHPSEGVPPVAQYASSRQVTFGGRPDVLSSPADNSELSEGCPVDSQATISGPSLVSEIAKIEPPLDHGGSIEQRRFPIARTGYAFPEVECEREESDENRERLQLRVSQATVSLNQNPPEKNETLESDDQIYYSNTVPSNAVPEKSLMVAAQISPVDNLPLKSRTSVRSEAEVYSLNAEPSHALEHASSRERLSVSVIKEDEAPVKPGGTPVISEGCHASQTPRTVSEIVTSISTPDTRITLQNPGVSQALSSDKTADCSQTRENRDDFSCRGCKCGSEAAHHEDVGGQSICKCGSEAANHEDVGRQSVADLEAALQQEKERCRFLLESLVKMEQRFLLAEREKRVALAAAAELERSQTALLALHCCETSKKFEVRTPFSSPDFSSSSDCRLAVPHATELPVSRIPVQRISQTSSGGLQNLQVSQQCEATLHSAVKNQTALVEIENPCFGGDVATSLHVSSSSNDQEKLGNGEREGAHLKKPNVEFVGEVFSDESSHLKRASIPKTNVPNYHPRSGTSIESHNLQSSSGNVSRISEEKNKNFEVTAARDCGRVTTTQDKDQLLEVPRALESKLPVIHDEKLSFVFCPQLNHDSNNNGPEYSGNTSNNNSVVFSDPVQRYSNQAHDRITLAAVSTYSASNCSNPPIARTGLIANSQNSAPINLTPVPVNPNPVPVNPNPVPVNPNHVPVNPTPVRGTEQWDTHLAASLGLPTSDSDSSDSDSPPSSCFYDFSNNDGNETVRGKHNDRRDGNNDGYGRRIDGHGCRSENNCDSQDRRTDGNCDNHNCPTENNNDNHNCPTENNYVNHDCRTDGDYDNHNCRTNNNYDSHECRIDRDNDGDQNFGVPKNKLRKSDGFHNLVAIVARVRNGLSSEPQSGRTVLDDAFMRGSCNNVNSSNISQQVNRDGDTPLDTAAACNETDSVAKNSIGHLVNDFCIVPELDLRSEDNIYPKEDTEMRSPDERIPPFRAQNFCLQFLECSNLKGNKGIATERLDRPSYVTEDESRSLPDSLNVAVPCASLEAPVAIEKLLQTVKPFGANDCTLVDSTAHASKALKYKKNSEVHRSSFNEQGTTSVAALSSSNTQSSQVDDGFFVVSANDAALGVTSSCSRVCSSHVLTQFTASPEVHVTSTSSVKCSPLGSDTNTLRTAKGPAKKRFVGRQQKSAVAEGISATSASKVLQALDEEKALLLEELRKLTASESTTLHHKPKPRIDRNQRQLNLPKAARQFRDYLPGAAGQFQNCLSGATGQFRDCLPGATGQFRECLPGAASQFQNCLLGAAGQFQDCHSRPAGQFQNCLPGATGQFQNCLPGAAGQFQDCHSRPAGQFQDCLPGAAALDVAHPAASKGNGHEGLALSYSFITDAPTRDTSHGEDS